MTDDRLLIVRQCDVIAAQCSAITFGGTIGDATAAIMAALDVIQHAARSLEYEAELQRLANAQKRNADGRSHVVDFAEGWR